MSDYCSQASIATESPLYGTAGNDQRWLLLEYNGAWQAKAIQDNTLPPAVADWFRTQAAAIGARPQFIKRAAPYRDEWIRLYVVDTDPRDPKLLPWHFKSYDEMLDLDVTELLNAGLESSQEQLLLICTNGKRDNCCAKFGLPIYNALAQEDGLSVWQTTHTAAIATRPPASRCRRASSTATSPPAM